MRRHHPLRQRTPLRRRTPLQAAVPLNGLTREVVLERDGFCCIGHVSPAQARQLGYLVRRGVDPALVPVFTAKRGLVFLTGDGWFAHAADGELGVVTGVA